MGWFSRACWKHVVETYVHISVREEKLLRFGGLIWDWDRYCWRFYLLLASSSPMSHKASRLWTKLVRVSGLKLPSDSSLSTCPQCECQPVYVCMCPPPNSSHPGSGVQWLYLWSGFSCNRQVIKEIPWSAAMLSPWLLRNDKEAIILALREVYLDCCESSISGNQREEARMAHYFNYPL